MPEEQDHKVITGEVALKLPVHLVHPEAAEPVRSEEIMQRRLAVRVASG